jgi:hypothetical protein
VQADTPELRGQAARFLDCLAALVQGREYLITVSEWSPRSLTRLPMKRHVARRWPREIGYTTHVISLFASPEPPPPRRCVRPAML